MKKYVILMAICILVPAILVTYLLRTYSYERTEVEATVVECDDGHFQPDENCLRFARAALAKEDFENYNLYSILADEKGKEQVFSFDLMLTFTEGK